MLRTKYGSHHILVKNNKDDAKNREAQQQQQKKKKTVRSVCGMDFEELSLDNRVSLGFTLGFKAIFRCCFAAHKAVSRMAE